MKISTILQYLESIAPPVYQEHYDNAGLLTGDAAWECSGILVTLDSTLPVVQEALGKGCNLIIAHHPIIFGGLKKISAKNHIGQTIIHAIKNNIAIYAIHTNLDNVLEGVNGRMADRLGLSKTGRSPLLPRENVLCKLFCFTPVAQSEAVRTAIFSAGAGHIGDYSECSFEVQGAGSFKGGANTHPFAGKPGSRHIEKEIRIEVVLPAHLSTTVINAMLKAHPYEEPAYDLIELANSHPRVGSGLIGFLPEETDELVFLEAVKEAFGLKVVRHTPLRDKPIKKVAICGGSGSFLISNALSLEADFFLTADLKYHEFFQAEGRLVIADIGHFESEQFTVDLLSEILREKFLTFAVLKSDIKTNPVNYYI